MSKERKTQYICKFYSWKEGGIRERKELGKQQGEAGGEVEGKAGGKWGCVYETWKERCIMGRPAGSYLRCDAIFCSFHPLSPLWLQRERERERCEVSEK